MAKVFGVPLRVENKTIILTESDGPPAGLPTCMTKAYGPVLVVLAEFPYTHFANTPLTLSDVERLPDLLRTSLLEGALNSIKEILPPKIKDVLGPFVAVTETGEMPYWLKAVVTFSENQTAVIFLGLTHRDVLWIIGHLGDTNNTSATASLPTFLAEDVTLRFDPIFAKMTLSLKEVRSLGAGDALLPNATPDNRQLHTRHISLSVARSEESWTITEVTMNDTPNAPDTSDTLLSLDDLPVTLTFATQPQDLPLKALYDLAPGGLCPLDINALEAGIPVRILANGAQIGAGHLIQIDDHFAVRIAVLSTEKDVAS